MKILLSAFRCEPNKGSEPGVGWNTAINLAKIHDVWVLTKKSNQAEIENELSLRPVNNITFIYYDFDFKYILNEKFLGEQMYYVFWQMAVYRYFIELDQAVNFDVIHHITFNQYRSPSFGYFTNKKMVIGPIGGAEILPPVFYKDLKFATRIKEVWRRAGADRAMLTLLQIFNKNTKVFLLSSHENSRNLQQFIGKASLRVFPSIGINANDFVREHKKESVSETRPFTIIYAGTAKDWKGLHFLLQAFKIAYGPRHQVHIKLIGIRNQQELALVNNWIDQYGLVGRVSLVNFMPHNLILKELMTADLSVYPAFRDSGSMSVLEACACGCPVVCFDTGGQDAFPDDVLIKVSVQKNYRENLIQYAAKLTWAYENQESLDEIGDRARAYAFENFTWQKKAGYYANIYESFEQLEAAYV